MAQGLGTCRWQGLHRIRGCRIGSCPWHALTFSISLHVTTPEETAGAGGIYSCSWGAGDFSHKREKTMRGDVVSLEVEPGRLGSPTRGRSVSLPGLLTCAALRAKKKTTPIRRRQATPIRTFEVHVRRTCRRVTAIGPLHKAGSGRREPAVEANGALHRFISPAVGRDGLRVSEVCPTCLIRSDRAARLSRSRLLGMSSARDVGPIQILFVTARCRVGNNISELTLP